MPDDRRARIPGGAFVNAWPTDWVTDDQGEALPPLGADHTGWPLPAREFHRNTHYLTMSTHAAVEMGLIAPPPGYVPWTPPPVPWHRRLRGRARGAVHDTRMLLASAVAGFDVTDHDGCS